MIETQLGPFLGLVTSLDARFTPDTAASDMANYMVENGSLTPYYGFKNLDTATTNFESVHGLEYIQGYNSSNVEVEEYVTFERLSTYTAAKCRAFSRSVTSGAETAITNGGSPVDLTTTGYWRGVSWQDTSYFINPNDSQPIYKHTIGSATSWTALTPPGTPSAAPTVQVVYGANAAAYKRLSWAGLNVSTGIAYTGNATATGSAVSNGILTVAHTGAPQRSSFEIDMSTTTAGGGNSFDWYDNDIFGISLASGQLDNSLAPGIIIDPATVVITFTNSAGSPVSISPTAYDYSYEQADVGFGFRMMIRINFNGKTRSDWGAGGGTVANIALGQASGKIKKIKVEYTVLGGSGNTSFNTMRLDSLIIGGVEVPRYNDVFLDEDPVEFAYSHYNSSTGFESGLKSVAVMANTILGAQAMPPLRPFGVWLTVTGVNSSSADNNRLYVRTKNPTSSALEWRRVATQADSTLAIPFRLAYPDRLALTAYTNITPFTTTGAKFAVQWKGWLVWFYTGGYQNIRHSRVGDPEKQAMETDSPNDINAINHGATFSMADNFGDEPENAFPCDDVLIICGKNGIYAQQGPYPTSLTAPVRLPSDQGVCNPYGCARWVDDEGNPGVVFVSRNGDGVYFAVVTDTADERGKRVVPLDTAIRGQLLSWLRDGQSLTSFDTCRVWVDQASNALWVCMGTRALVLRRPSVVDGKRYWEKRIFTIANSGTIGFVSSSTKRRVRWIRSTGLFDENEYDSTNNVFYTGSSGSNRDGGSAMSAPFWTSKKFVMENSRVDAVMLERDDTTDTPSITCYSTNQPSGIALSLASGARFVRFSHLQTGFEHQFKITGAENHDPIRRATFTRSQIGRRVKVS